MLLECEQGNTHEGIQGNWLARLESWRWEEQCLHSERGMGILQSGVNLIVMLTHLGKDWSSECFLSGLPCHGGRWSFISKKYFIMYISQKGQINCHIAIGLKTKILKVKQCLKKQKKTSKVKPDNPAHTHAHTSIWPYLCFEKLSMPVLKN